MAWAISWGRLQMCPRCYARLAYGATKELVVTSSNSSVLRLQRRLPRPVSLARLADSTFWREIMGAYEVSLVRTKTVVGLKGLPGQPGLGIGHRPKGQGWLPDPTGHVLAEWIGDEDAKRYMELVGQKGSDR